MSRTTLEDLLRWLKDGRERHNHELTEIAKARGSGEFSERWLNELQARNEAWIEQYDRRIRDLEEALGEE